MSECLHFFSLLQPSRSKVTVFLVSIPAAVTRAVTLNANAATATGTAPPAAMRRPVLAALMASFPVKALQEYATQPRSAATTRRDAQMGRMKKTATTANPGTSTVGRIFASLRRGGVTDRRTAWTAATRETVWPRYPGRSSLPP